MIIELVGLPASGKTHVAHVLESDGYVKVGLEKGEILPHFFAYAITHPYQVFRYAIFLFLNLGSISVWYLKCMNLFVRACAVQHKAEAYSKAVIDQGLYQNMLSLFVSKPSKQTLYKLSVLFPDNVLWMIEVSESVRKDRLSARGTLPREEISKREAKKLKEVSEAVYPTLQRCFEDTRKRVYVVSGEKEARTKEIHKDITYATFGRMPTEKAHGASIAHMCASFVNGGFGVELKTPDRSNSISEDTHSYYGVPATFTHTYVGVFDLLSFCTFQVCFFIQKILFAIKVSKSGTAPIVYTRDPEVAFFLQKRRTVVFEAHRMPSGIKAVITTWLVRNVSFVVANSRGTADAFSSRGIRNVIVAPNGFDAASFEDSFSKEIVRRELGVAEDAKVALYVGSLELWKGVQTLFEASKKLQKEGFETVIIGGSEKEVRRLQEEYPDVTFLGFKPYKDLAKNLKAADILVLPNTKKDTQSLVFTSPIKLFGYMASGVPIVASDISSIREIVSKEMSALVTPDDVEALVSGIMGVVQSDDKGVGMASRAKKESEKYTWDTRAQTIISNMNRYI